MALTKIKTQSINDDAITTAKINNNAVTDAKVADDITAGAASTAATLATARNINGVSFNGSSAITVTAAAGTLTGATLASGVTASSLTSVGTLTALTTGAITQNAGTFTIKNASSDSNGLKIYQDSGDASKIYNHYNGTLQLGVGSTTALTIDSSENSTFAGTVILGDLDIIPTSSNVSVIKHDSGSGSLTLQGDQVNIKNSAADETCLSYNDGGGVTFPNNVNIGGENATPEVELFYNHSNGNDYKGYVKLAGNDLEIRGSNGTMEFYNGSVDGNSSTLALSINSSQNATFAGQVTVNGAIVMGSGSYISDDHANFGIGAIVSNWGTNWDVLNVGHSSSYWCEVGDYADRSCGWGNNLYHNGSNYKTIYEDQASAIVQKAGEIKFYTVGVKATTTNMTSPGDNDERGSFRSDGEFRIGQGGDGYFRQYQINSNAHNYVMYTYSDDSYRWNRNGSGSDEMRLDSDGDLHILGSLSESSDVRLKKNIKTIDNALSKVNQLRGVTYNWNKASGKDTEIKQLGMIADEVEEIIPELVKTDTVKGSFDKDGLDNIKSLKYGNVVGLLVEAVKELSAKVTALESA